ncbi:MAG: DJ-1/PfpI family protein [Candidatus Eremiobacteraeota bacterium]|nr:DJ-1/PfpI family protein [Candidatus Eremiobacteraeota bacterium]
MNRRAAIVSAGMTVLATSFMSGVQAATPKQIERGIRVAFVLGPNSNLIDVAGPFEVFSDAQMPVKPGPPPHGLDYYPDDNSQAFVPYTVSDAKEALTIGSSLTVLPTYTYADAPVPQVIVMGAQSGQTPAKVAWIREMSKSADVVMSVCTGAFLLAKTGLLDGLRATTHHDYYDAFEKAYPNVTLVRGPRFVDNGKYKTAGGLTSGFELALHVVEQYYGDQRASMLARYLEYNRMSERPA